MPDRAEVLARWSRSPHEAKPETVQDRVLADGCLNYGHDDPARRAQARDLALANPDLARSSIHAAAALGDADAVRAHLAADPALARTEGGPHRWEPLVYLAYARLDLGDPVATAKVLLDAGADPNAGFLWEGNTPPFTALTGVFGQGEGGWREPVHPQWRALAELLLDAGADPNDEQTLYNRHFIADDSHLELLLARGLGTDRGGVWAKRVAPLTISSLTAMLEDQLVWATARGFADRVRRIVAAGVDPRGVGMRHPVMKGYDAIGLATRNGDETIAQMLVAAGAARPDLDPPDALLAAAMRGDAAAVAAADPAVKAAAVARDPGRLELAVELGRQDAVRLLIALGFGVSARLRGTPLHSAAFRGDRPMVDLLLSLGADPTVRDTSYDGTPAGWARHAGHDDLAAYLDSVTR